MLTAQGDWDEDRLFFDQLQMTKRRFSFDELAFEAV